MIRVYIKNNTLLLLVVKEPGTTHLNECRHCHSRLLKPHSLHLDKQDTAGGHKATKHSKSIWLLPICSHTYKHSTQIPIASAKPGCRT